MHNFKKIYSRQEDYKLKDIMMCRVCTNPAEIAITDRMDDVIIMTAIKTVANIVINKTDIYPKYVCKICLGELKIAYEFKRKCEATDMMFRKVISSESSLDTTSQPMTNHDFPLLLHEMKQNRLSLSMAIKHEETNCDKNDCHEAYKCPPSQCFKPKQSDTNEHTIKNESESYDITTPPHQNCDDYVINDTSIETNVIDKSESKRNGKKLHKIQKCKRCDLKFDSKDEYEKHRKDNSCIYHPCPQCGKLVLNLASHEKIVHSRPNKYTCHQCGKIYYSSGALINHMHTHKDTKEYFCEHCPYRGKRKSYLVCHMRVHTGEHRYLCAMCPLKFTNPSNLSKHQLIHFNKKFECTKCKRLFRQERNLKEHFDAAHLNIRYRCSICGRDLISRKKLLNHELRVHKRQKHKLFEEVQRIVVGSSNNG